MFVDLKCDACGSGVGRCTICGLICMFAAGECVNDIFLRATIIFSSS